MQWAHYGPYAFLDAFESGYVCNHTDHEGRYSFDNQPRIGHWNLSMLGRALSPLITQEKIEHELEKYKEIFTAKLMELLHRKLGLASEEAKDGDLFRTLFTAMENGRIDMTPFFRSLSRYDGERVPLLSLTLSPNQLNEWLDLYDKRLENNPLTTKERHTQMLKTNPKYILKNYILQEAIDAAEKGDFILTNNLLTLAQNPYDEHESFERYAGVTPLQRQNLKLSCSS
ncbi:MAG: protein adenylyltransferase SelO family protein [Sulfuricurvum sp.]